MQEFNFDMPAHGCFELRLNFLLGKISRFSSQLRLDVQVKCSQPYRVCLTNGEQTQRLYSQVHDDACSTMLTLLPTAATVSVEPDEEYVSPILNEYVQLHLVLKNCDLASSSLWVVKKTDVATGVICLRVPLYLSIQFLHNVFLAFRCVINA